MSKVATSPETNGPVLVSVPAPVAPEALKKIPLANEVDAVPIS